MSEDTGSLSQLALQKFKQNFWGVFSFWFIVFVGVISVFAYAFAPDNSQHANQMHLSIHSKRPGFQVQMLTLPSAVGNKQSYIDKLFFGKITTETEIPISSYYIENNKLFYTEYASDGLEGAEKTFDLNSVLFEKRETLVKNQTFLFGTDKYGRDLLSRILVGARISFFIGFVAVFISLVIGVFMGSVAGYFGGRVDAFIMWIINVT